MGTSTPTNPPIKRVFDRRLAAVILCNGIPLLGAIEDPETGKQYAFPGSETLETIVTQWKADAVRVNPKTYSAAWSQLRNAPLYNPIKNQENTDASDTDTRD